MSSAGKISCNSALNVHASEADVEEIEEENYNKKIYFSGAKKFHFQPVTTPLL